MSATRAFGRVWTRTTKGTFLTPARRYLASSSHEPKHASAANIFDVKDRVYVVTGGAQGLGLELSKTLAIRGANTFVIDRNPAPSDDFHRAHERVQGDGQGTLRYLNADVCDAEGLDLAFEAIAAEHGRMDGLVAAAAIQNVTPALDFPPEKITEMMKVNFNGVYHSAQSCARMMHKYQTPGSMVLVGSMSGLIANRALFCSVYNASKAAVIQLGRSLAMEWGQAIDGKPIRVNVLCPGNIVTPMAEQNFRDDPSLKAIWENGNMMGRLSTPEEYRGAVLFMLSDASSFMTGSHMVIDGGYTAW
ncbi:unnamed protein product [Zymoseptoria tritici ST99CH_3D1]|nr:unnamed protein product [Zymoseptoria tritici ST99CH_3D1]